MAASAKEKAKAGVWLLEQAVLEIIHARPGITKREMLDELELRSPDEKDNFEDTVLWGIHNRLRFKGLLVVDREGNLNHFSLTEKAEKQLRVEAQ